jgi:hypothetical protein
MKRAIQLFLASSFAASFVGAQCGNPTPLTRSCPGSTAQTAFYKVTGGCGDPGTISVSVSSAGSCAVNVEEATAVGLPVGGSFSAASTTYDLTKGSWNLAPTNGGSDYMMQGGTYLDCTGTAATAAGDITLTCQKNSCMIGDTDDVVCSTGGSCTAHLSPTSSDAGITADVSDASMSISDGAASQ